MRSQTPDKLPDTFYAKTPGEGVDPDDAQIPDDDDDDLDDDDDEEDETSGDEGIDD